MRSVLAILRHPATLRRVAFASVIVNVVIVVTGGLVRLTDSGLGCPTWPRCTDDSYVPTAALGIHGAIEFGNRTLISVVGGVAVAAPRWSSSSATRSRVRPSSGSFGHAGAPATGWSITGTFFTTPTLRN